MKKYIMKCIVGTITMFSVALIISACVESKSSQAFANDYIPEAKIIASSKISNLYRYYDCETRTVVYITSAGAISTINGVPQGACK